MKPSLRTLLAFEDNIFDAEYRQELERRLPNREQATEILCRIRQCLRDPSLGVPGTVEGREELSSNRVAEYLDHQLPAEEVEPFEEQCLNTEVFLAELASCHQILAHVLGEPARISRDCRRRCYELAYAPKVLPFPGSFENSDRETPGLAPVSSTPSVSLEADRPLSRGPDVFESGHSEETPILVSDTAPSVDAAHYEASNSVASPVKNPSTDPAGTVLKRERGRRLPYRIPYRILLLLFFLGLGIFAVSRGIVTVSLPFGDSAQRTADDPLRHQEERDRHLRKIQENLTLLSFEPDKDEGIPAMALSTENPPDIAPSPFVEPPKNVGTKPVDTKDISKKPEPPHHLQLPQTQTVLEAFPITNPNGASPPKTPNAPAGLSAPADFGDSEKSDDAKKKGELDKKGEKGGTEKSANSSPSAKNESSGSLSSPAPQPEPNPPIPAAELPRMDTSLVDTTPDKMRPEAEKPCEASDTAPPPLELLLTTDATDNSPKPLHPFEMLPENASLVEPPEFHETKTEVAENVEKSESSANTELASKESSVEDVHEETPGTLAENAAEEKSEENTDDKPEETLASATPFVEDEPLPPVGRHFVETSEPVIITEDLPVEQTVENKRHKRNPLRPGVQNGNRSPKNVPVFELLDDLDEIASKQPKTKSGKAIVPSTPTSKTARLALRPDTPTPADKEEPQSKPVDPQNVTTQEDRADTLRPSPKVEDSTDVENGGVSSEGETEKESATSSETTSAEMGSHHLHDPIVRFGQINPMSRIFVHEQAASGAKPLGPPSEPSDFITSASVNTGVAANTKNSENALEYPKSVDGDIVPTSFTGKDESETGKKAPLPNDKSLQVSPPSPTDPEAFLPATEFPPTTPPASPPAEADPWLVPPPSTPDTPPVVPSVTPFVKPTVSPPSPVPHEEPLPDPLPEPPRTSPPAQPLKPETQEEILGRTLPSTSPYLAFLAADADSTWQLGTPDSPLYANQYLLTVAPFRFPLAMDNGLAVEMVGDSKMALLPPDEEGIRGIHIDYGRVIVRHASGNTPATNLPTASANRPVKLRIQSENGMGIAEISPGGVLFIDTFAEIVLPSVPDIPSPDAAAPGDANKPAGPADHSSMRNRTVVGFLPERGGALMLWQGLATPATTSQAPGDPGISGEAATALPTASPVQTASFDIPSSILFDNGRYIGAPLRKSPSWIRDTGNEQERIHLETEVSQAFRLSVDTPTASCEAALSRLVLHDDPAVRALGCRLWGDLGKFDVPLELLTRETPNDPVRRVLVVYFREVLRRDSETIERLADAVAAHSESGEEATR